MKLLFSLIFLLAASTSFAQGYNGCLLLAINQAQRIQFSQGQQVPGFQPGCLVQEIDNQTLYYWNGGAYEPIASTAGVGGVSSLNTLTGAVNLVAGSGISLTPSGQNITIGNTGSAPTGNPNTFAGFDNSGTLYSTPWGIDANGQATGTFTGTIPITSVTSLQIFPNVSTPLSGGYEGVIESPILSSTMAFTSDFNAENQFNSGFNNSGGINIYNDQSVFAVGASTAGYTSFSAFPAIAGTTSGYNGVQIGANITSTAFNGVNGFNWSGQFASPYANSGGTIGFTDGASMHTGASTNSYTSAQLSPAFDSGSTVGNVEGVSITPSMSGSVTGNYTGIQISGTSTAPVSGNAQGININLSGVSDSNPQGVVGINSDSRMNVDATTKLKSALSFQIGNRVESLLAIPSGSPVTGTDSLGNDFAGDLDAQDNLANGPTAGIVGWSGVGFISEMVVGSGKTVDTANIFLAGAALPAPFLPGDTDGGTVTNLSMIKTAPPLNEGGTVNFTNIKAVNIAGTFSTAGANAWGIYQDDPALHNHFAGLVDMSFLQLNGSTSGVLSAKAAPTTTSYTVIMPSAQGTGALTNDGAGNLSWASSSGANTALSNLTTTSINQDLTSDTDITRSLGTTSKSWLNEYIQNIVNKGSYVLQNSGNTVFTLQTTSSQVQFFGTASASTATDTFNMVTGAITAGSNSSGDIDLKSGNTVDGTSGEVNIFTGSGTGNGSSGPITISTGNPAAAGDSGGITLEISAPGGAGSQGEIELLGHFVDGGNPDSNDIAIAPTANLGSTATATATSSTDMSGQITLVSGGIGQATGAQANITFDHAYKDDVPRVFLQAANASAALLIGPYVTATTTGFTVNFAVAPITGTTYIFNYHVIGSND